MKKAVYIFTTVVLFSCGGDTSEGTTSHSEDLNSEETTEEVVEESSSSTSFTAYFETDRYEAPESYSFDVYSFEEKFEYAFPEDSEFRISEKSDHITHYKSTVYNDAQYIVNVDDYTDADDVIIDGGFTKWVHEGFINSKETIETIHEETLSTNEGVWGNYSIFKHFENDTEQTVDIITYGFEGYIVTLKVTGIPFAENSTVVEDYMNGFKLL